MSTNSLVYEAHLSEFLILRILSHAYIYYMIQFLIYYNTYGNKVFIFRHPVEHTFTNIGYCELYLNKKMVNISKFQIQISKIKISKLRKKKTKQN